MRKKEISEKEVRTQIKQADKRAKEIWANADFALSLYNKGASIEDISLVTGWDNQFVARRIKMAQAFPQEVRTLSIPIDVYDQSSEYPDPQRMVELAWENNWHKNDLKNNRERSFIPENPVQPPRKTPLEIALDIDDEGMTTARRLYLFLELNPANYSKWVRRHVEENIFAELDKDYFPLILQYERDISAFEAKQIPRDYKITSNFAKKLAMVSYSIKGEEVRDYFIAIEQKVKALANGEINPQIGNWILDSVDQFGKNMPRVTKDRVIRFAKGA